MADTPRTVTATDEPNTVNVLSLLDHVAGIINDVQTCQQRMEERQLELENSVKNIQANVIKLIKEHTTTSGTVEKLLEKTQKVSCHIKDVRVRIEKQNVRVKKVEETQAELLNKNKFRVVIYQVSHPVIHRDREISFKNIDHKSWSVALSQLSAESIIYKIFTLLHAVHCQKKRL